MHLLSEELGQFKNQKRHNKMQNTNASLIIIAYFNELILIRI